MRFVERKQREKLAEPGTWKKVVGRISVVACALAACTSIQVRELDPSLRVERVCIEGNQKVLVTDFVDVVREGFMRHGIATEFYLGERPSHCEYKLTYTALRSWDLAPYLSHAELWLYRNDDLVAQAEYHLKGKGGYSMTKWQGTRTKMTPVIDQLLAQYRP